MVKSKVAGITTITNEMGLGSNPDVTEVVRQGLARSLAVRVDQAFFGNLPAPAPPGSCP
ncbi:hypothetical protein AB0C96_28030 [Streptomyces sp. NPDC048506]|uniref:hypothetical protein n=1 Tax=Streptomyces sp. NPDC048506 TaxID=3155028 RepID=UPI0034194FEA